eukprot:m.331847 g.331847  ORF g.331847 m.331847 type:complete len:383 (-) comp16804_c0_seq1:608-1756(-)
MAVAVLLTLTLALSANLTPRWHELDGYSFDDYVRDFQKAYPVGERPMREKLFQDRLAAVREHNANTQATYKKGINHFSDWTDAERKQQRGLNKHLLYKQKANPPSSVESKHLQQLSSADMPPNVDHRKDYPIVMTPVKNQAECGSCWAFASTETIESHFAIKYGFVQELAEQFVLDCVPNPEECGGTGGCAGGTAELAYDKIATDLKGIPTEWVYPYLSARGNASQCHGLPLVPQYPHKGEVNAAAKLSGYTTTVSNNYTSMKDAVVNGPLAISVDAGAWHDYESGIFNGGNSTNPDLDHLVQLVGYGSEGGNDYWIVRNSWTPIWGEKGFIRLARHGDSGTEPCGMDITPLDGNGCKGGPPTVKVCGQNGMLFDGVYPTIE